MFQPGEGGIVSGVTSGQGQGADVRRIVLAANPEEDQPWVADATAQLARETDASVAVVSVDELETELLSALPRVEHQKRADEVATAALERLQAAGVTATKHVRAGPALEGILEFADEQDADLIVLGPSVRSRLAQRLLGSVHLGLIQRSSRPVLVVTDSGQAA